jgi:hypothetical protein
VIHRALEQLLLVPEGRIQAGPIDLERRSQVTNRGTRIAALPENPPGFVESFLFVEAKLMEGLGSPSW